MNRFSPRHAVAVAFLAATATAQAAERPLPSFADGTAATTELWYSGVVNRGRLETDFVCTVVGDTSIHLGVEIYDTAGTRQNNIAAGVGALLDVPAGATVTFGTSGSKALLETVVIPLGAVAQGSARVVASGAAVRCTAVVVDNAVTPPLALGTLPAPVRVAAGTAMARPLPSFADGSRATHAALFPGLIKRGRMESEIFCTSLAQEPVAIGVEVYSTAGTRLNDIANNGAVPRVQPGATVTIGTSGTASFLETTVIVLPAVSQGLARVVTTSDRVWCNAVVLDAGITPPTSISELRGFARVAAAPTSTATATATATPTLAPPTPTPTAPALPCTGDCSADGNVTVDEIVQGVNIALGAAPASACPPFDRNQDGEVTVDEILQAVAAALSGCSARNR